MFETILPAKAYQASLSFQDERRRRIPPACLAACPAYASTRLRFLFAVLLLDLDKARAGSAKDEGEAEEYGKDGADDVVVVDDVLEEPHQRKPVNVAEKERVEGVLLGGRGDTRVKVERSL